MRTLVISLFVFLLMSSFALAAEKIAVVNMMVITRDSVPGKEVRTRLESKFKGERDSLEKQKTKLEALRKEIQTQGMVLSQAAKLDKELEFKRKLRDYQDSLNVYQRKLKTEENRLAEPVIKLIVETIQSYGKKSGYTMILDGTAAGVLYVNDVADVTKAVIREVDKAHKAKK